MSETGMTNQLLSEILEEIRGFREDFNKRMSHLELEPLDQMFLSLNAIVSSVDRLGSDLMGQHRFSLQDLGVALGKIEESLEGK